MWLGSDILNRIKWPREKQSNNNNKKILTDLNICWQLEIHWKIYNKKIGPYQRQKEKKKKQFKFFF